MSEAEKIAEVWLSHFDSKDDSFTQAVVSLNSLVHDNPDRAWSCIKLILAKATKEEQLEYIGSDSLEDLIFEHGTSYINELDTLVRQNPLYKSALRNIWATDAPNGVGEKIESLKQKYQSA